MTQPIPVPKPPSQLEIEVCVRSAELLKAGRYDGTGYYNAYHVMDGFAFRSPNSTDPWLWMPEVEFREQHEILHIDSDRDLLIAMRAWLGGITEITRLNDRLNIMWGCMGLKSRKRFMRSYGIEVPRESTDANQ